MKRLIPALAAVATATGLLSGCATPMGPTVPVMPGPTKPFQAFQEDQAVCRQFADQQTGGAAGQSAPANQWIGTAVLGTLLGAGLGAAIGGGQGAAIGAASGAIVGTGVGAGGAGASQYGLQRRYNIAYEQCMYARGNQVPGFAPPPGANGPVVTPVPQPSSTTGPAVTPAPPPHAAAPSGETVTPVN